MINDTTSRRHFLRGLGAGGLLLTPALRSIRARAEGTPGPLRVLFIYTGNGFAEWRPPTATGAQYEFRKSWKPLEHLRSKLSMVTGLEMKMRAHDLTDGGHMPGWFGVFTGSTGRKIGGVDKAAGISLDRFLAQGPLGMAKPGLPILPLGCRSDGLNNYNNISFDTQGNAQKLLKSPREAYDKVFALAMPGGNEADAARRLAQSRALIDFLKDDVKTVMPRLAPDERMQLETHLTSLESLDAKLSASKPAGVCEIPSGLLARTDALELGGCNNVASFKQYECFDNFPKVVDCQIEILTKAFACDVTRVGVLSINSGGGNNGGLRYRWLNDPAKRILDTAANNLDYGQNDHHEYTHGNGIEPMKKWLEIDAWHAAQVAKLFDNLHAIKEGDRSIFENTLVIWCSENNEIHSFKEMAVLLAGGAGGRLKMGEHMRFEGRTSCDLLLTIARLGGYPDLAKFGDAEYCTGPLSGLLT